MGNIIQFPTRHARRGDFAQELMGGMCDWIERNRQVRKAFSALDPKFRAYCSLHDEVAVLSGFPYATYLEHVDAWEELLVNGQTERELERLRKIVNPTGRLRGT